MGGAAQGLTPKVAAYVSGLKESEDAEKVVAELAREDNRARTPMEVAILQVGGACGVSCVPCVSCV